MPATATRDPEVVKLEPGDYIVPMGGLHNMSSAAIWDADPTTSPDAHFTPLAAIHYDHHAKIVEQEDEPRRGRPVYFVHRHGMVNLELHPRCDQTYWFRATFRKPVKYGTD